MAQAETQHLQDLLAETQRLRARFEATQPNSRRLPILIKDELRLRRLIAEVA